MNWQSNVHLHKISKEIRELSRIKQKNSRNELFENEIEQRKNRIEQRPLNLHMHKYYNACFALQFNSYITNLIFINEKNPT